MTLAYLDSTNLDKDAKILELGFGGGQMAKRILDRGYEYYGLDISSGLVEVASKRCEDYVKEGKAHFKASSIEKKFDFKDAYFDAVLVCGALQYLAKPSNCFEEVSRVLKNKSTTYHPSIRRKLSKINDLTQSAMQDNKANKKK